MRRRLQEHLDSALQMARLLLDEVLHPRHAGTDGDAHADLVGKAGGEVAMLLRLADRACADDAGRARVRALARDLAPLARTPRVWRSLVMRPSRAPMHAMAHLCLQALGERDDALDRVVRLALACSAANANERVPYRLLDAAWTRHLALGDGELQHPALGLSPLGAGIDLVEATVEDAYAFTHALPYASDFGRVPLPPTFDASRLAQLADLADAVAVQALASDDLDLLAEVLMAPAVLRRPWTPILAFGWQVLDRVWTEHGFVPGPGLPPPVAGENRTQTVRRVLGTVYHSTLAAGMTCAALLAADALPPTAPLGALADADAAPPAIGSGAGGGSGGGGGGGGRGGSASAWRAQWQRCPAAQRQQLGFLLLSLQLREALAEMDLAEVHRLVRQAAQQGWLDQPLVVQSAELLGRACAGV
ncbi:MAG: hypothetical protein LCI02_02480 [Proteobacteria bacterium]|nr:hypothetical protein [Pseudomonadota bacterium]